MQTLSKPNATHSAQAKPRLMDQVRAALRVQHYALSTERTYCHWIMGWNYAPHIGKQATWCKSGTPPSAVPIAHPGSPVPDQ